MAGMTLRLCLPCVSVVRRFLRRQSLFLLECSFGALPTPGCLQSVLLLDSSPSHDFSVPASSPSQITGATAQLGVRPVDPKHVIKRLAVANLARKQDTNLYFPYKPAQRKAWARVEHDEGVQERAGGVAPLAPCLK